MAKSARKRGLEPKRRSGVSEVYVDGQHDLARLFGVAPITVDDWKAAGAPDADPRRGWPVGAWVRWRIARLQDRPSGNPTARLKMAQAKLAERKLAEADRELLPVLEVEAERVSRMRWFVGAMTRAAGELAGRLAGQAPSEVRRIVGDYFQAVRQEAVKRCRKTG